MQSRIEAEKARWRGSVQNVCLKRNQVIIGQVGDVSCRVIAILQLCGELAAVLEPETDDRGEGHLTGPQLESRTLGDPGSVEGDEGHQ